MSRVTSSAAAAVFAFLTLCGGCTTATEEFGAESVEVQPLVSTAAVRGKAKPALLDTVTWWEQHGGKGGWFRSVLPWEGSEPDYYYMVREAPSAVDPLSPVFLLRTENTQRVLLERVSEGVPIVIGEVPPEIFNAAVFGEGTALFADAKKAARLRGKPGVMVITRQTQKATLAHEMRHYQDFGDGDFEQTFADRIAPFTTSAHLTNEELDTLSTATLEWRGHASGETDATDDAKHQRLIQDRAGNVIVADSWAGALEANGFLQGYMPALRPILTRLRADAASYEGFVRVMEGYDVSAEGSRLNAQRVF